MRFNNIQVLRVAAALGVVLHHLGWYGRDLLGVERAWFASPVLVGLPVPLFFAVSGFVLAHAARAAPPGRFLLARAVRLYPGYWLAVLAALGLMSLGAYTEAHRAMTRFVSLGTATLWPAGPGATLYVLGIEWSLVYEVFLSAAMAGLSVAGPRRGVAVLAAAWLAVLGVKMAAWPDQLSDVFPRWTTIALSAYNAPFLFGVLAYQARGVGRRLRWAVLPAVVVGLAAASTRPMRPEQACLCWGAVGAAAVWLAVQFRQFPDRHPLVRLGDCTYGLFLLHVPLMLAVLYAAVRLEWAGRVEALWGAGAVAVGGGLLFGRLEAAMHTRLRPLARARPADLAARLGRFSALARVRTGYAPR